MSPQDVLRTRRSELTGRVATAAEAQLLRDLGVPQWLIDLLLRYPLIGATLELDAEDVEMEWLTPDAMRQEMVDLYPGISAAAAGYLPIGGCLIGTGDPYFISVHGDDPAVVRIPHTAVNPDMTLDESQVERVAPSLSDFFSKAQLG